jgi:beta-galactosidase
MSLSTAPRRARPGRTRPVAVLVSIIAVLVSLVAVAACTMVVTGPAAAAAATYTPPALRQRLDLNSGWKFTRTDVSGAQASGFDDASWSNVTVPHT